MLKCKQILVCLENESGFFSYCCLSVAVLKRTEVIFENIWGNCFKQTQFGLYKKKGFRKFFGYLPAISWPLDGTVVPRILL